MVLIAAATTILLGLVLAADLILARRRTAIREGIERSIGLSARPGTAAPAGPRLDAAPGERSPPGLGWLPAPLVEFLRTSLAATGDSISALHLFIAGGVAAAVSVALSARLLDLPLLLVAPIALLAAAAAPAVLVKFAQSRFQSAFLDAFPDALDLIVRAVRAGLPISEAIDTVSVEAAEPLAGEFRRVTEAAKIGADLDQELLRAADRIRVIEFRFFVVALALQRQTGGNLAETLDTLSLTIRRRREVLLKARAIMSESRASAWLIGALPFVGALLNYFLNRSYILFLFDDPRGKIIIAAAIGSLAVGALMMRQMIKGATR